MKFVELKKIDFVKFAIINITQWDKKSHFYGKLMLVDHSSANLDNFESLSFLCLGKIFDIVRYIRVDEAEILDKKDGCMDLQKSAQNGYVKTNRFDSELQLIESAINDLKRVKIHCPVINVYRGVKKENTKIVYV